MNKIRVRTKAPYDILVGENIAASLKDRIKALNLGNYAIVITNRTIYSLYKRKLSKIFGRGKDITFKFCILPDTEKAKSFASVLKIIDDLAKTSYKKQPFFICWGGGVIGDLGAFCASIYKRGCPLIQMPTTLLAQIDSAIGGKTAIDLRVAKNLVGTFWQPSLVICDVNFLRTLKTPQIKEGLAEAIKYGLIKDKRLFVFLEKNYKALLSRSRPELLWLIDRCARIKQKVVEKDERETKGVRTILNFGHTIGHGIEASSNYKISHGKAVALGMIAALHISQKEGVLLDQDLIKRAALLIEKTGLATRMKLDTARIMKAIKKDKKFIRQKTRMVLLRKIGLTVVKEDIEAGHIRQGLKSITS